jgi:hypothetical protein
MKKFLMKLHVAISLVVFPLFLFSNDVVTKPEWFGQWSMNHDGHVGTLTISDTKVDCATSGWCDMTISYVNSNNTRITGSISRIDDNWQHMVFYLDFPGNRQKFDAYLFSWDKNNLAGTTYWNSRTFGFFANKRVNTLIRDKAIVANTVVLPTNNHITDDEAVSKKILSGDTIEIKYKSGKIRWAFKSGWVDKFPDGRESKVLYAQTPAFVPPIVVSDQNVIKWLKSIQETLLEMIKEELLNDTVSIEGILAKEKSSQLNTYQVINNRFYFLNYLNNY